MATVLQAISHCFLAFSFKFPAFKGFQLAIKICTKLHIQGQAMEMSLLLNGGYVLKLAFCIPVAENKCDQCVVQARQIVF